MALTVDEMRMADTARLEKLIADIMLARRSGRHDRVDGALDALNAFITRTPFIDLQQQANTTLKIADIEQIDVSLTQLAELAARLVPAGEVFKSAAKIAASGKTELLFPRLAATASQTLEIFSELQATVDRLAALPENANSLNGFRDAIGAVNKSLVALQDKIKAAQPA